MERARCNIIQSTRFSPSLLLHQILLLDTYTCRGTHKNCYTECTLILPSPFTLLPRDAVKPFGINLINETNTYKKDTQYQDSEEYSFSVISGLRRIFFLCNHIFSWLQCVFL